MIFPDLYFVSSDVEINFSLGQRQTVLLMCCWRGQLSRENTFPKQIQEGGQKQKYEQICMGVSAGH